MRDKKPVRLRKKQSPLRGQEFPHDDGVFIGTPQDLERRLGESLQTIIRILPAVREGGNAA
jgi:hypothetical protein